jgi:hypothetical protein
MNARIAVIAVLAVSLVSASAGAVEAPKKQAKSDSLAPFPHRIVLLNEEGNTINPAKDSVHYSPAQTCGKCHDYPAISKGWHFNARQASVPAGRFRFPIAPGREPSALPTPALTTGSSFGASPGTCPGAASPKRPALSRRTPKPTGHSQESSRTTA